MTNKMISSWRVQSAIGFSLKAGETMANTFQTTTLFNWAMSGFRGATMAGATFTGLETGIIAVYTGGITYIVVSGSLEAGIFVGSIINVALPQ
jgi:hypothetical protein